MNYQLGEWHWNDDNKWDNHEFTIAAASTEITLYFAPATGTTDATNKYFHLGRGSYHVRIEASDAFQVIEINGISPTSNISVVNVFTLHYKRCTNMKIRTESDSTAFKILAF